MAGYMKISSKLVRLVAIGAMLASFAVASGCRKEEQGRILYYQKGTYLGKPDQKLTDAQEHDLRSRARNQSF